MIKSIELRLGNWVNIPECGINTKVESLASKALIETCDIDLDADQNGFEYSSFYPIAITSKVLEKSGFTKCTCKGYRLKKLHLTKEFYYSKGDVQLQSVHQLQNLYFALTGEELNISL